MNLNRSVGKLGSHKISLELKQFGCSVFSAVTDQTPALKTCLPCSLFRVFPCTFCVALSERYDHNKLARCITSRLPAQAFLRGGIWQELTWLELIWGNRRFILMQIGQSYKPTPFHLWRMRWFELGPFPEACSVPVLCVFLLFLQSTSLLTFGACSVAKKWQAIGNNSLLSSIRIKTFVLNILFYWLLVSHRCGDTPGV